MRAKEVVKTLYEIKLALLAVPILAMIISTIFSFYILSPVYKSSTTLMVFKQPEVAAPYDIRIGTITLNQRLVKTYSELAKSTFVLDEVIKQNKLKMSVEDLRQKIRIELLGDTEFLKITVESSNPTMAAMLANEMARILLEKVAELMNFDNIQVIDSATPAHKPVWPNHTLNILLAGVIGLILVFVVALFKTSLKDGSEKVNQEPKIIFQPISPNQAVIYHSSVVNETHENSGTHENYEKD